MVWIRALRLCIQFWWSGVFTGSGPIFKLKFAVTAFKKSSTEYSGSVLVNTINGLSDDIGDSPTRYEFIVICSNSAAIGIWESW